ncbi:hypothetical protein P691DRAFT_787308 [Macrolepiota fuliginosa MF-IS2]|uniref:Uncharacterized protein n=1 Tax=Macrolepiota fuliginosa MF-IS2 TaxID=1400762 RepID=A0A9P5X5W8_9AGAR|nr:hypothetical protein P691DRAFT_787308 [Macrolepiota fuliginosa MF-IS2]
MALVAGSFTFVIALLSEEPVSPSKPRIIPVVFEKGAAPAAIQAGYLCRVLYRDNVVNSATNLVYSRRETKAIDGCDRARTPCSQAAALHLILFFAAPTYRFWIPFQFIARRLFFLSLFTLYINDGVHERRCVTFSSNAQLIISSASGFSAAVDSSGLKPHNIGGYSSRDAHSENTFVQKGHAKDSSVFSISVTREVIEDSGAFPEK